MSSVDARPPAGEQHPYQETINGLLRLAGWLLQHPEVPIDKDMALRAHLSVPDHRVADESERIAYVRMVAPLIDAEPYWRSDSQFIAEGKFGGGVEIEAYAIAPEAGAAYAADQAELQAIADQEKTATEARS